METIDINVGKYKFKIIDNTLLSRDQIIYSRNFKIGGNISDCVNISIRYIQGKPVSAYIPLWELRSPMTPPSIENVKGIISMVKTLLNYVNIKIPTITEVSFEDKSNIECATDNTKKVTNICPIPLYYFSIAFNGETWYEKHFNARQKDINKHTKYKEKINKLLYFEEEKSNTTFLQFLEIAQPPKHLYDELEKYYNISKPTKEVVITPIAHSSLNSEMNLGIKDMIPAK
jgi:hypothetical protein